MQKSLTGDFAEDDKSNFQENDQLKYFKAQEITYKIMITHEGDIIEKTFNQEQGPKKYKEVEIEVHKVMNDGSLLSSEEFKWSVPISNGPKSLYTQLQQLKEHFNGSLLNKWFFLKVTGQGIERRYHVKLQLNN